MINDLLVMSRNQQKNALVSETMKANQLWGEVLDNAAFEAEQMGKSLTVNYPPGPWPLYGNPNALESALENIVRNALRYSHTKIEVGFSVDKDGITITVDDDGPGVSPEDREQIFRPFYRTDEARDRESGGTGLGLAIVESAMQQHRGWVKADDSPLGGCGSRCGYRCTSEPKNHRPANAGRFLSRRRDLPGDFRRQNPLGAVIPHVHPGNFAIAHFEAVDKAVIGKRATVGPFAIQRTVGINHNVIIMLHRIKLAQRLLHPLVASAVKLRDICRARHRPASGEGNFHLRVHIRCGAFSIGNHRGHQKFFYDRHRIFSFSHNPSFHFGGVLSPHSRLALSSILPLKRRFCMVRLQLADSPAALNSR
ncbi:two-component sensor kinase protein [Salmonella enterica subsp. enterica]|uniref:histidine kinase n=1 Tax=Salmonella enterica I TaxID=59201 RepID=A0A379WJG0_SALET|nr:two-component sensor kinase protein [Salmonella enterica subsp. enterica]